MYKNYVSMAEKCTLCMENIKCVLKKVARCLTKQDQ